MQKGLFLQFSDLQSIKELLFSLRLNLHSSKFFLENANFCGFLNSG